MGARLEDKKRNHDIINGILRASNALLLFTPQILENFLSRNSKEKIRNLDWSKKGYKKIPDSDPLFVRVKKQAAARDVEVENFYVASKPKKINAGAINIEKDKAVAVLLSFDPRRYPDGDRILDAILAHELSHIKNNDGVRRSKGQMVPLISILLGLASLAIPSRWRFAPLVLGVGAGIGTSLLKMAAERQEEYIADLEGAAAIGDPEAMIKAMELLAKQQKVKGRKPGKNRPGSITAEPEEPCMLSSPTARP